MSDKSSIEWTDATWNPVTGCTKVTPGCDNCYAETFAERFRGVPGHYFERGFDVVLRPDKLDQPLRWRKPRRIFVNSMSDLFHDRVPDEYIAKVFAVMAATTQHTYQLLTKRHGRMRSLLNNREWRSSVFLRESVIPGPARDLPTWPLPNLWLGVSVEDQKRADLRIPALLETPAAVRWLSMEPLLGPVDLAPWLPCGQCGARYPLPTAFDDDLLCDCQPPRNGVIDWVVVGGESGPRARPMHPDWARSLRDQCIAAGIPFFFKQWGEFAPMRADVATGKEIRAYPGALLRKAGKKVAGRELDGRTWDEYPTAAVDAEAVTR